MAAAEAAAEDPMGDETADEAASSEDMVVWERKGCSNFGLGTTCCSHIRQALTITPHSANTIIKSVQILVP